MADYASEGVYVNYLGTAGDEGTDRLAEAYGPGKYERLVSPAVAGETRLPHHARLPR